MKYSANVQPIIAANCYSCHGNGLSQNGVSLDSYSKVKQRVNSGQLMGVITHAAGYTPMPYGKAKLSDCDINKIKSWIDSGALEN
jgi:mono/diheme cytochrome c family protein